MRALTVAVLCALILPASAWAHATLVRTVPANGAVLGTSPAEVRLVFNDTVRPGSGIKAIRNYSSTNSTAFADYSAKADKYGHGDVKNSTTMALYGIGVLVGDVLKRTGTNPTKDALPGAIEALVNYNNGVTMALSFGKGVRVAEVGMWPIQCCNSDNTWKVL